jgi:hypothetical protein
VVVCLVADFSDSLNGPVYVFADTPEAGNGGDGGERDITGIRRDSGT